MAISQWEELESSIHNCRKCKGLNIKNSTQSCPGYGDKESSIVLIGQSLCYKCMGTQIPFTGGSGKILDEVFENSLPGKKENLFITNLVKCHPPQNRPSKPEEKDNCLDYLKKEIELIQPKLVIPLGADAISPFLGRRKISDIVNHKFTNEKFTLVPVYHPSYIMRRGDKLTLSAYILRFIELINEFWEEDIEYKQEG